VLQLLIARGRNKGVSQTCIAQLGSLDHSNWRDSTGYRHATAFACCRRFSLNRLHVSSLAVIHLPDKAVDAALKPLRPLQLWAGVRWLMFVHDACRHQANTPQDLSPRKRHFHSFFNRHSPQHCAPSSPPRQSCASRSSRAPSPRAPRRPSSRPRSGRPAHLPWPFRPHRPRRQRSC
jgi:hypothetical protein